MFSAATLAAISAGALSVRSTVERPKLRDNEVPGKPSTRKIATCWSCGRPIALKPGFRVYHCESCDVGEVMSQPSYAPRWPSRNATFLSGVMAGPQ